MDKGYYIAQWLVQSTHNAVAIHNKNGQGLLPEEATKLADMKSSRNPQ